MVKTLYYGTHDIPLKLADAVTKIAAKEWEKGTFIDRVSKVTRDLLRFWDPNGDYAHLRKYNFHEGQWTAILNTIYVHEILKVKGIHHMYMSIYPELLQEMDLLSLKKDRNSHPKYCIKMATGTGKTWVLTALLIWQFLNAKYEVTQGKFYKNFLLVAPGVIVYERLLNAYLGKRNEDGTRDFNSSDFKQFENLFLPSAYREETFGFLQSSVVEKEEIGIKVTGEGLIAITNWHLLVADKIDDDTSQDSLETIVNKLLPITPGVTAGHSLKTLDNIYFGAKQLEYLANLPNLVVCNDEAHHLAEGKKYGEILEKKWQESLNYISKGKKDNFIQFDFSATPYSVTGGGQKRTLHFSLTL
jgi:type III restriction enzyme